MSDNKVDVMLHIDESLKQDSLESIRGDILGMEGVVTASYNDKKPHLMIIEYDPENINSSDFLSTVKSKGIHAQLVGL